MADVLTVVSTQVAGAGPWFPGALVGALLPHGVPGFALIDRLPAVLMTWALTYALHSTIILGAAWLLVRFARLSEGTKDVVWKAALLGGIVTATVQMAMPAEPLAGTMQVTSRRHARDVKMMYMTAPQARARIAGQPMAAGLERRARGLLATGGRIDQLFIASTADRGWPAIALAAWLVLAGGGLLWLTLAHARLTTALWWREELAGGPMAAPLDRLLARAGIRRRIRLSSSPALASPAALPGGEVCIPDRALRELDDTQRESILAHEVAHVVRRDPEWLLLARVLEVILFFQPLNRLARRRMQETAEYLCDEWAVQRTGRPLALAKCLAEVAEWLTHAPRPALVSAMVESPGSPLVERVRRILHPAPQRASRGPWTTVVATLAILAAIAGVAPGVAVNGGLAGFRGEPRVFIRAFPNPDSLAAAGPLAGASNRRMAVARVVRYSASRTSGGEQAEVTIEVRSQR
jgi:beta-lactamase regulating signal transducer with metallopeptidase domain